MHNHASASAAAASAAPAAGAAALPTTPESLLPLVLAAMERTPDARFRQLLRSLTTHLHRFVLDNAVTEAEWHRAVRFLIDIGQQTGAVKNEVILASDLFGVSTLVALLNDPRGCSAGQSDAALLGPFWRANAPLRASGHDIAGAGTVGMPLEVRGSVVGEDGEPIAGAEVDVWQASPVGLYENQDPQQPDMNLRGRFSTDAAGRYHLRTVFPAGYPVPTDGACGELLRAQERHPYRPAHLHFMVSKPGHRVLITQVFPEGAENLHSDPVFGVTTALVGHFEPATATRPAQLSRDFRLSRGEMVFPHPPIP